MSINTFIEVIREKHEVTRENVERFERGHGLKLVTFMKEPPFISQCTIKKLRSVYLLMNTTLEKRS